MLLRTTAPCVVADHLNGMMESTSCRDHRRYICIYIYTYVYIDLPLKVQNTMTRVLQHFQHARGDAPRCNSGCAAEESARSSMEPCRGNPRVGRQVLAQVQDSGRCFRFELLDSSSRATSNHKIGAIYHVLIESQYGIWTGVRTQPLPLVLSPWAIYNT